MVQKELNCWDFQKNLELSTEVRIDLQHVIILR